MSRSDDGKCPDIGNWCSYPREICEGTCLTKEMEDLRAENERLKAALKPVLEVGWEERRYNYCSGTVPTKDLVIAVRDAQRIYNGGAK